jgi:hypothetical protein
VAYEPELATRKLCPETTRDLLRQQTRWVLGFLQVARAGVWRRLPERRQRLLARATLLRPLVEALTGVAIAAVVAGALLGGAPPIVVLLALVPVVPTLMTIVVEMAGLAELSRTHGSGIGWRDHIRLLWSIGPYWLISAVAAVRALLADPATVPADPPEDGDLGAEPPPDPDPTSELSPPEWPTGWSDYPEVDGDGDGGGIPQRTGTRLSDVPALSEVSGVSELTTTAPDR